MVQRDQRQADVTRNAQLCLTNEEMRRELVRNLKLRLRETPRRRSPRSPRTTGTATAPVRGARRSTRRRGVPPARCCASSTPWPATSRRRFPHVAIDTLAYQYTRKPPEDHRPRPNVVVRLCSIECSFARPLDDPPTGFPRGHRGLVEDRRRLYVWDYTTNFSHYIQPHPNYWVLAPNIRFFVNHNVTGVFEQGAYQSWGSEMAELRAWVLAKLLWNPALDAEGLRRSSWADTWRRGRRRFGVSGPSRDVP